MAFCDMRRAHDSKSGFLTKQSAALTKPFSWFGEDVLKPGSDPLTINQRDQTTEFDHVGIHHRLILPPVSPEISAGHAKAVSAVGLRSEARE
jgi:hypothetical protein